MAVLILMLHYKFLFNNPKSYSMCMSNFHYNFHVLINVEFVIIEPIGKSWRFWNYHPQYKTIRVLDPLLQARPESLLGQAQQRRLTMS